MRKPPLTVVAWSVVALVTVLRAAFAASLPLTGDEAYYWEWSRRLAAGYADHPPAVAFAIFAFSWLGRTPFAVRAAFVLCGLGTALATAGAAKILAGDRRAGAIAALAVTLAPMMSVAFGIASPDGPFAFAWALTLYFAALAFEERRMRWFVALGFALGFALLSRFFSWALLLGIAAAAVSPGYREVWRRGLALSFIIALLVFAPFIVWNAQHNWISFTFALLQRHPSDEVQVLRPLLLYALGLLAFSPGLWIAATTAAAHPRQALVTWTALPLSVLLFVIAVHERVEVYWFIGPYISLCVAMGMQLRRLGWTIAPAAVLSALIFAAGIAPRQMYAALVHAGVRLSDAGPFEMFTYPPLARKMRAVAAGNHAVVMTDGYGFSSLLDFYGGLQPVVIGYDAQGEEARSWFTDANAASRAVFLDKVPLSKRPDFARQLARACARVKTGQVLEFEYRRYFTTWCEGLEPGAIATLRWQVSKS
jgi:Dolichyl-phosphate-mannose-protein mannosyltransferase